MYAYGMFLNVQSWALNVTCFKANTFLLVTYLVAKFVVATLF